MKRDYRYYVRSHRCDYYSWIGNVMVSIVNMPNVISVGGEDDNEMR